jgi:hypothetical protein
MSIELLSEDNNNTWWFYNCEVFLGEAKHCQQRVSKENVNPFCIYILRTLTPDTV